MRDDDSPNEWARLLRTITARSGWSVARLARAADIHRATIFRWLRGDISNLTLDSVYRIATAAEIDFRVALNAAAALVVQAAGGQESAEEDGYVDPDSGELYTDLDERAIWELRRLSPAKRRSYIYQLRADLAGGGEAPERRRAAG